MVDDESGANLIYEAQSTAEDDDFAFSTITADDDQIFYPATDDNFDENIFDARNNNDRFDESSHFATNSSQLPNVNGDLAAEAHVSLNHSDSHTPFDVLTTRNMQDDEEIQVHEEEINTVEVVTNATIDDALAIENNEVSVEASEDFSPVVQTLKTTTTTITRRKTTTRRRPKVVNLKQTVGQSLAASAKNDAADNFKRRKLSQKSMPRQPEKRKNSQNIAANNSVIISTLLPNDIDGSSKRAEHAAHNKVSEDFKPTQVSSGQNEHRGDHVNADHSSKNREVNATSDEDENSNSGKPQQNFHSAQSHESAAGPHSDGRSQKLHVSHSSSVRSNQSTANEPSIQLNHASDEMSPSNERLSLRDNSVENETNAAKSSNENLFNSTGNDSKLSIHHHQKQQQQHHGSTANNQGSINENPSARNAKHHVANDIGEAASIWNDENANERNPQEDQKRAEKEAFANATATVSIETAAGSSSSFASPRQPNFHTAKQRSNETANDVHDDDSLKPRHPDIEANEVENDSSEHENLKSEQNDGNGGEFDDNENALRKAPRHTSDNNDDFGEAAETQGQKLVKHEAGRKERAEHDENVDTSGEFNSRKSSRDGDFSTLKSSPKNRRRERRFKSEPIEKLVNKVYNRAFDS